MNINGRTGVMGALVCSLLFGSAFASAADEAAKQQKEAAKQRYEAAKEQCKQLSGSAKDECEKNAKAELKREKEAIHKDHGDKSRGDGMME